MFSLKTCNRADECRAELCALLSGKYEGGVRWGALLSSFDVVVEHHKAIIGLVRAGLYRSAFALVRAIVETCYRGHWLARCASDMQIRKLIRNKSRFPSMKQMADEVDRALDTEGLYRGLLEEDRWDAMCDYTHTGARQLSKRSLGARIQPNYSDEEVISVIGVSTSAMLMFGRLLAIMAERKPAADQIEQMIIDFATALGWN